MRGLGFVAIALAVAACAGEPVSPREPAAPTRTGPTMACTVTPRVRWYGPRDFVAGDGLDVALAPTAGGGKAVVLVVPGLSSSRASATAASGAVPLRAL